MYIIMVYNTCVRIRGTMYCVCVNELNKMWSLCVGGQVMQL